MRHLARRLAGSRTIVVITGESGVGKALIARDPSLVVAAVLPLSFSGDQVDGEPRCEQLPARTTGSSENAHVQTSETDAWFMVDGVEFYGSSYYHGLEIQISADINGVIYKYPSKGGVEWLEVGPDMAGQVFHLRPTKVRYTIRFEARVRVANQPERIEQLKSVQEVFIDLTRIPYEGRYILHAFDQVRGSRAASADAALKFRIAHTPD